MSVSITWRYRDLAIATVGSAVILFWWDGQCATDIPAWIQDHITNAENFISQATTNYHEYNEDTH
jgi:hypothetical protein